MADIVAKDAKRSKQICKYNSAWLINTIGINFFLCRMKQQKNIDEENEDSP